MADVQLNLAIYATTPISVGGTRDGRRQSRCLARGKGSTKTNAI